MEEEQKELGFADIMKELGKIMESLQKIMPTQSENEPEPTPEPEAEPTPAPQPNPESEPDTETDDDDDDDDDEKTEIGDAEEIDKILKDA